MGRKSAEERRAYARAYYAKNHEAQRAYFRGYELARQEALAGRPCPPLCELCGGPPRSSRRLHFDHDHKTGKFRGWVCVHCNSMLSRFDKEPEMLQRVNDYFNGKS